MFTDKFFVIAQYGHQATMILLVILSILSIAFILERWFTLRTLKSKSLQIEMHIRETLQSNNLKEIEEMSRDKDSVEGRALSYGLRHLKERGSEGLEEIFSSYALIERPRTERYLNFLATVGSNAPFIGLLGTVFGIMEAFRDLATSQGEAKAVMIGISQALVATALGLFVAIPAVIAYNHFQRQVKSIFQNLESVKDLCVAYAKNYTGRGSK